MEKERQRKKRSDAKKTIKPTMNIKLKETIHRISYITEIPVKDVGEALCEHGISSNNIINNISKYFKRDVRINNTLHIGSMHNPTIVKRTAPGTCDRITIRVNKKAYDVIGALAYGLDCTVSRACSKVIEESMHDFEFVDSYIMTYLAKELDKRRLKELQKIMDFVNQESEEESTYATLLTHIVDEVKEPYMSLQETVDSYLINYWRD